MVSPAAGLTAIKTIPTIELILIVGMVLYVDNEFYVIQILESFYVEIIIFPVIFDGQTPMWSTSVYSLIDTHSSGLFAKIPETIMNTVPSCKHGTVCCKTVIILADFVQVCQLFAILIIVFFSAGGFPPGESTTDGCCLDICKIYSR